MLITLVATDGSPTVFTPGPLLPAEMNICAPLPAHPIFQRRVGYGGGYPWTIAHRDYRYQTEEYPETQALVDNSLVICSELHPIYCQPTELIEQYAVALVKIFSQRDALLAAAERRGDSR